VLKNKKRSVFFSAYLFGFLLFFLFFITLCFSNILASSIFLGVMCVPEFFGYQWTEYNIGHGQISGFRRKQLIFLNFFDLILLFLRRFLIYFIFFFYLYPYLFFFMLWFTFFLWFKCFYSRLLKTKIWSFFFSAHLFGFLVFADSSSHCVSLTSSHQLFFFCFMSVLEFFGDQWNDSSYSSYILTQISLMLFFKTYRLEMKSF